MKQVGSSLVGSLAAIALLGLGVCMVAPVVSDARGAAALTSLDQQLRARVFRCRSEALASGVSMGLVFRQDPSGGWSVVVAVDGDDDGIRSDDLERGRDRTVGRPIRLAAGDAGPGILRGVRIPDPSGEGWLEGNLDDPVRAGRGNIITFTPAGTATPASVFLTDHRRRMRVLRVYGSTARARSRVWRDDWDGWRDTGL